MIARFCIFCLYVIPSTMSRDTYIRPDGTQSELTVEQRNKFLQYQLEEQLRNKMDKQLKKHNHFHFDKKEPPVKNANIDYVDLADVAITPIDEKDDRKKQGRFKLRQLATSTVKTTVWTRKSSWPMIVKRQSPDFAVTSKMTRATEKLFNPVSDENMDKFRSQQQVKPIVKKSKKSKRKGPFVQSPYEPTTPVNKPVDVFYRQRRLLTDEDERDSYLRWTHCEDLITPYLTGMKGELGRAMIIPHTHRTVVRLVHLISTNVTSFSKEDIYSLMYQISNIQVRLFQWSEDAIHLLLNTICKGRQHTYRNLKKGITELFQSWHLDFSNVTNLLKQSRLFRPYCINTGPQEGSTKTSKGGRQTAPTTKCGDEDD